MHGPRCSLACGIMPPALAGGFLSTGPPRMSYKFLIIFSIILRFSLCSSILLLRSVNIFMTDTLNSLSGKLLIFVSLKSFSGDFLCSLVWNQSLSLLILPTYVCLSLTGKMKKWSCCRCFTWFRNKISLATRARHSMDIPYVGCMDLLSLGPQDEQGTGRELNPHLRSHNPVSSPLDDKHHKQAQQGLNLHSSGSEPDAMPISPCACIGIVFPARFERTLPGS